jgi:hypothetical protein
MMDDVKNPEPTPLEFLRVVYCNEGLPVSVRLRAATEAAQYMHPKLGAVATLSMSGDDFAGLLERSIERSRSARDFKPIGYTSAPAAQGDDEHS